MHWFCKPEIWSAIGSVISAAVAFVGLLKLWQYTTYTKQLKTLAEETRRAEILPLISASEVTTHVDENRSKRVLKITNLGRGPALSVRIWVVAEQSPSRVRPEWFEAPGGDGTELLGDFIPGHSEFGKFEAVPRDRACTYVIACRDIEGGRWQLHEYQPGDGTYRLIPTRWSKTPKLGT